MELRGLAAALVVLAAALVVLAAAPAAAQTAAEPGAGSGSAAQTLATDVRPVPPHEPAPVGIGARLGYGWAYADGVPDAHLFRLDYETFVFITPRHTVGGMFGFLTGFDYWKGGEKDNWGFGLPAAFIIGMRAVAVRGYVGAGVNGFTIDQWNDDTGFGWMAPMAVANVGLDLFGFTASFDTRVSRRWQFGSPDHTQWMFSVMIGAVLEPRHNRRFFEGDPKRR